MTEKSGVSTISLYDFAQKYRSKGYDTYDGITDPDLKSLPDNLDFRSASIGFKDCSSLRNLPNNFKVAILRLQGDTPVDTLPPDIYIESILCLRNLKEFKFLPEGLAFKHSLTVDNCPSFVSLSSGVLGVTPETYISVADCPRLDAVPMADGPFLSLLLENCQNISSLPDVLHLSSTLRITNNAALKTLPSDLKVKSLELRGCTALETIPPTLTPDKITIAWCPNIEALPRTWRRISGGGLYFKDAHKIESLPPNLSRVDEDLVLVNCGKLKSLSEKKIETGAKLVIKDCKQIERLPSSLKAVLSAEVSGLPIVSSLPDKIEAGYGVKISDMDGLRSISTEIVSRRDVLIEQCKNLVSISRAPAVRNDLNIEHCQSLNSLPPALTAGGRLAIIHCDALRNLPPGISANDLVLSDCHSLTALPPSAHVKNSIIVNRCDSFSSLPGGTYLKGDLTINFCPALEEIPSDLIVDGHLSLVGCDGVSIPEELIERMGDRITLPDHYTVLPNQAYVSETPTP